MMVKKRNAKITMRIYIVLITIFLIVGVSGCSIDESKFRESYEENDTTAEDTVEQIFIHLCKGDFEGALEYCKKDSNIYYGLAESTQENILTSFAQDFSNEPEFVEYFNTDKTFLSLFQIIKSQMFDDYEIVKSQEKSERKIIVYVKADFLEDLNMDTYMQLLNIMRLDYYNSNYEEIEKIYEKKGETAAAIEIIKNISTTYCQLVKDDLTRNASYVENQYAISVERVYNEWLATELERIDDITTIESNSNSNLTGTPEPTATPKPTVTSESTITPKPTATSEPTATPTLNLIGGKIDGIKWTYTEDDARVTFSGNGEITTEMVKEIYNEYDIEKIVIEEGISKIADRAFANMYYLEAVEIGASVQEIGNRAFSYCTGLTNLDIPISVEKIHSAAFYECSDLEEIIIRNPVAIIDDDVFDILEYVTDVTVYGYEGSSAEKYAERHSRNFKLLEDKIVWPTSSLEFVFKFDSDSYDITAYAMEVDGKQVENFFLDIGEINVDTNESQGMIKYSKGTSYLYVSEDKSYFKCRLNEKNLSADAKDKASVSGIKFGMTYDEVQAILENMLLVFTDLNGSIYSPDKSVRYDITFDWETEKVCEITVEYDESKSVRNFYK